MKILNLKVEGFRSLKTIDWSPGDLNVVIGPNAGGKSNLLQLLEMISASARGKLSKFVKNQGGMQPLVWDGKAKSIRFSLTTDFPEINQKNDKIIYDLNYIRLGETSSYQIKDEQLELFINESPETLGSENSKVFGRKGIHAEIIPVDKNVYKVEKEDVSEEESVLSIFLTSIPKSEITDHFWILDYQKIVSSWKIHNEFDTSSKAVIRQPIVTSYEKKLDSDGHNFISFLHTLYEEDGGFKKEINAAMGAAFGEDFEELSFPPAADTRTQMRIRWKSLKTAQSAANLSDGTLRFLYLLTILANPEPPALIAIDEPETGLHPKMLSIIAEYAVEAARRTQVILTTHSPELLGAFRDTQPTVTVCEWQDGQSKLWIPPKDKLDYWLKEYTLGDLYRTGQLEQMD